MVVRRALPRSLSGAATWPENCDDLPHREVGGRTRVTGRALREYEEAGRRRHGGKYDGSAGRWQPTSARRVVVPPVADRGAGTLALALQMACTDRVGAV